MEGRLNRRQLLIGAAATVAVSALPAVALPSSPVLDSVLGFLDRDLKFYTDKKLIIEDIWIEKAISTDLITKYPDLFPAENHNFEGYPTNIFYDDAWDEKAAFQVGEGTYHTVLDLELLKDLKRVCGIDPVEELVSIVTEEIAAEIRKEQARLGSWKMISYQPVKMYRCIDSNFKNKIGFKTRHFVVPQSYRMISMEEELAITLRKDREYLRKMAADIRYG